MNWTTYPGSLSRMAYRLMLRTRWLGAKPVCKSFSSTGENRFGQIQQIYVINLDRQVNRWDQIQRELEQVYSNSRTPLNKLAKRFSAVDARYYTDSPSHEDLQSYYSLADQLFVEPHPLIAADHSTSYQNIAMTRQEVAVALSHIALWKLIASSSCPYTLVLEDDICFRRDFAPTLDKAWGVLTRAYGTLDAFDILYLSYKEAKNKAAKREVTDSLFRPLRGLWQLSGYVLSNKGAKKLLGLLPVRGPVDLWINHQFDKLDVFATHRSVIDQRLDFRSDNAYSILPVLSSVGVFTQEKPLLFKSQSLPQPIFAFGKPGTGLTSLAMALSMLGYRCCSDIIKLPESEHDDLFGNNKSRVFNAYVNIDSLWGRRCIDLAELYPRAKFIFTAGEDEDLFELDQELPNGGASRKHLLVEEDKSFHSIYKALRRLSTNVLVLPTQKGDKWDLLCQFLECEYPSSQYPSLGDLGQRRLSANNVENSYGVFPRMRKMKFDTSPWIAAPRKEWQGVPLAGANAGALCEATTTDFSECFQTFDSSPWMLLDDTFPDNLAIFDPGNFSIVNSFARMTLRKESARVREYTSASICSRRSYLYGRFSAVIRPASVPGLVTGVFLHRNSPRQEIDIEFLGKDTTKLLVNVYYNPGNEGANFEFGYRGTPVLIDLGFDASKDFHQYSIEWSSVSIRWFVDSRLIYERANWNPTPIPHLPMQFYVNLWHSKSEELAGRLFDRDLPAYSDIGSIGVRS